MWGRVLSQRSCNGQSCLKRMVICQRSCNALLFRNIVGLGLSPQILFTISTSVHFSFDYIYIPLLKISNKKSTDMHCHMQNCKQNNRSQNNSQQAWSVLIQYVNKLDINWFFRNQKNQSIARATLSYAYY